MFRCRPVTLFVNRRLLAARKHAAMLAAAAAAELVTTMDSSYVTTWRKTTVDDSSRFIEQVFWTKMLGNCYLLIVVAIKYSTFMSRDRNRKQKRLYKSTDSIRVCTE